MKTFFDCIPCFIRQALDSARLATPDEAVHERVLREALCAAAEMDLRQAPPAIGQRIHRATRELTGRSDPYREIKEWSNRMALTLYPTLRTWIEDADNAGEIVFDRLLIERLLPGKVTVAVRGFPVINDATLADAERAGIQEVAEIIENGSDAPGTILDDCSELFRDRFAQADLVIAKGQGKYETLGEVDKDMYFLLKAKCPVIARDIGCQEGAMVLEHSSMSTTVRGRD